MSIQNIDNKELKRLYSAETNTTRAVGKPAGRETVSKSASRVSGKDQATLSESARLLAESLTTLQNTPAVRTDLVAQIKAQVDAGTYEIHYEDLAKKLAAVVKE